MIAAVSGLLFRIGDHEQFLCERRSLTLSLDTVGKTKLALYSYSTFVFDTRTINDKASTCVEALILNMLLTSDLGTACQPLSSPVTTRTAEEVGFEPTEPETGSPVFETGPFDHSGTPP